MDTGTLQCYNHYNRRKKDTTCMVLTDKEKYEKTIPKNAHWLAVAII